MPFKIHTTYTKWNYSYIFIGQFFTSDPYSVKNVANFFIVLGQVSDQNVRTVDKRYKPVLGCPQERYLLFIFQPVRNGFWMLSKAKCFSCGPYFYSMLHHHLLDVPAAIVFHKFRQFPYFSGLQVLLLEQIRYSYSVRWRMWKPDSVSITGLISPMPIWKATKG